MLKLTEYIPPPITNITNKSAVYVRNQQNNFRTVASSSEHTQIQSIFKYNEYNKNSVHTSSMQSPPKEKKQIFCPYPYNRRYYKMHAQPCWISLASSHLFNCPCIQHAIPLCVSGSLASMQRKRNAVQNCGVIPQRAII
jgi:hypothetical protein